ncbi:MAG: hypothetical protein JO028_00715 [Acidobacteriaceae bacterium]|nr:hypothetical protein [Acidobacteriaceae bacterium]
MTCKNVDILAITILLLAMALLSAARYTPLVTIARNRIAAERFHRPSVTVPKPPRLTLSFN